MTVRVERTIELSASPKDVWDFIADPEKRASAISVITEFERTGEHTEVWHVRLPLPLVDRTVTIETKETDFNPPHFVQFVGRSSALRVIGTHEVEPTEDGARLTNRFTVEGKLPGVERFFERNLDAELDNLEQALRDDLGLHA